MQIPFIYAYAQSQQLPHSPQASQQSQHSQPPEQQSQKPGNFDDFFSGSPGDSGTGTVANTAPTAIRFKTSPKHCRHDSAPRIRCGAKNASTETEATTTAPFINPARSFSFIDRANATALLHRSLADFLQTPCTTRGRIPSLSSTFVLNRS